MPDSFSRAVPIVYHFILYWKTLYIFCLTPSIGAYAIGFRASTGYQELLCLTMKDSNLERIKKEVFVVMLSHRQQENGPLLCDIQDKETYELDPVGSIVKFRSFSKTARDPGHRWTWVDTCYIDQTNDVGVEESDNCMLVWHRRSGLTIVYLSGVPPSSGSGALTKSVCNKRFKNSSLQKLSYSIRTARYISMIVPPATRILLLSCKSWQMRLS
jgi:hypothetical protein